MIQNPVIEAWLTWCDQCMAFYIAMCCMAIQS